MAKLNQAIHDLLRYNAAILPQKRSAFSKNHSHTTTLDSAYLVPLMWDRVLPGDEKKIQYSGLARMTTPLHPVMDECFLDVWAFYVPDRLWWNHAKEFYGENKDASFNPDGEYEMPFLLPSQFLVTPDGAGVNSLHSLSDYLGLPVSNGVDDVAIIDYLDNKDEYRVCVGPWRSYQLIWNEFFRNSSIQPALQLNDGDDVLPEELNWILPLRKVCKLPDMFTTLLITPQAGDDVLLPLGEWAPVVTRGAKITNASDPVQFITTKGSFIGDSRELYLGGTYGFLHASLAEVADDPNAPSLVPGNLWADLTSATAATINNLRAAITVQQLLETDAMAGKRYQNIIQAHFGVLTPDATLQRPELLGASRTRVGMRQVLQTSSMDGEPSALGTPGAVSVTNVDNAWICNKAFTEPGYIMVLGAIRPLHSYSQGINPLLRKLNRYDHYWPVFENLGNQPVLNCEIFFGGNNESDHFQDDADLGVDVFGYKEAWQEYRMMPNRVSGLMRPDVPGTLASWNYSTAFEETPILNSSFVEEKEDLIARTLAIESGQPQFLLDSYFDYTDIKNMGIHSIPGLTRL